MKQMLFSRQDVNPGFFLPAIIAGITLGIFTCGYWLIDLFAFGSRWILSLTLLISLLGAVGYFLFFLWIKDNARGLSRVRQAGLIVSSLLIGAFLFFTATDRWQKPDRYIPFLLPTHTLQVSVPPGQDPETITLLWFNTSLGDVSYDEIEYKGWKRDNGQLILVDPLDNQLLWSGKTGGEAQILIQSASGSGTVIVAWDGQEQVLALAAKKNNFPHAFRIPFYASQGLILLLGVLNVSLLSFPLCLLVLKNWGKMLPTIERRMAETSRRLDRGDGIVVLVVMILAFLLRAINLENLFPGVEEYNHLIAAKQIVQGVPMGDVYSRSLWLVTLPVSMAFKFLGIKLWAARLVGVIFNVLAIIPLYLITRKIARPVAILSILLYATSPWMIAISRVVREYGYYPFYYYWIIHWMILYLEKFPHRFRIRQDWKILFSPALLPMGLVLVLPIYYALFVDLTSTFQLIMIAYVMLVIFVFMRLDFGNGRKLLIFLFAAGVVVVAGISAWYQLLPVSLGFTPATFGYFFSDPPQQWYYGRVAVIPLAGVVGSILLSYLLRRLNVIPLFLLAVFGGFLSAFLFSTVNSFGARHLSMTQLWYIPVVALGLYLLWEFLQSFRLSAKGRYLVVAVLGLLAFNVQQTLLPITSRDPGMVITEEYHRDLSRVHEVVMTNVQEGDALISSRIYTRYVDWVSEPDFRAGYLFDINTTYDDVLSFMDQYPSGWIVIDKVRLDAAAFPVSDVFSKDDRITYIGEFGDESVWHWSVK